MLVFEVIEHGALYTCASPFSFTSVFIAEVVAIIWNK